MLAPQLFGDLQAFTKIFSRCPEIAMLDAATHIWYNYDGVRLLVSL